MSENLNSIGLVLNIAGVVMLFFFGWPQPNFSGGGGLVVSDDTPLGDGRTLGEHKKAAADKQRNYRRNAAWSLALIAAGFVFQLASTWA